MVGIVIAVICIRHRHPKISQQNNDTNENVYQLSKVIVSDLMNGLVYNFVVLL